ncbi:1-(5-phosphoribosyl)-5-[(5-phosphoribosylamino) methylideneamino] imidazole-4-carboxamide isomerase [Desulfurococcaceae archaeon AG1]|jgi:phosphoribosylformimino-5-aminoimidazole carboxamide ribotide isomerase|nr:1-(5-phosphoribosyl)-5-[(5-phosphoribosylamino) methylideneamino] imidazole-4-carboxamide isomerase [Desulfurococcaceae archaeon AG1]
MEIHVSLDIYRGSVVRMLRGDPGSVKVYSRDPLAKGLEILDRGVKRIHVVDLEAAIEGRAIGKHVLSLVRALKDAGGFVTVGGGIRGIGDLDAAIDAGADRVVVGTAIYRGIIDPFEALERGADRVVLAADARGGLVVHSGWRISSGFTLNEILERFSSMGYKLFLVTNTERDGSLSGLDSVFVSSIPPRYRGYVVYSGGVQGIGDLEILAKEGFRGVVIGKAFYEGLIDPKDLASLER